MAVAAVELLASPLRVMQLWVLPLPGHSGGKFRWSSPRQSCVCGEQTALNTCTVHVPWLCKTLKLCSMATQDSHLSAFLSGSQVRVFTGQAQKELKCGSRVILSAFGIDLVGEAGRCYSAWFVWDHNSPAALFNWWISCPSLQLEFRHALAQGPW